MFQILHDLHVYAPIDKTFKSIANAKEIEKWWTNQSEGDLKLASEYSFYFSTEYDWRAKITKLNSPHEIEWEMTQSDTDWNGTKIGFRLNELKNSILVSFYHQGWANTNEHFRRTSYCWAMYLHLLKQYTETGQVVPFEKRIFV